MADDQNQQKPPTPLAHLAEPEPEPAPGAHAKLRAFEDEHIGADAPRISGHVEKGSGSPFSRLSDEHKALHAALERLIVAEQEHVAAEMALKDAQDAHAAAEAAVADAEQKTGAAKDTPPASRQADDAAAREQARIAAAARKRVADERLAQERADVAAADARLSPRAT